MLYRYYFLLRGFQLTAVKRAEIDVGSGTRRSTLLRHPQYGPVEYTVVMLSSFALWNNHDEKNDLVMILDVDGTIMLVVGGFDNCIAWCRASLTPQRTKDKRQPRSNNGLTLL